MSKVHYTLLLIMLYYYLISSHSLTPDGLSLLSLKSAITPSAGAMTAFSNWNSSDSTPCKWLGIRCDTASQVISVSLANRGISGYIPSELGSLTSLRRLNLHSNLFTGPIPSSLFNGSSLHSLYLYNNNLSGPLPSSLCLQNVDVSNNELSGPIPRGIGKCRRVQRLILSGNRIEGEIPSGVWSVMGEMVELDLSSNLLSGKIPVDLGEMKSLSETLNLSFNDLTGRIPKSLGNLPMTVSFDLRGNNLSGEIPNTGAFASQGPTAFLGNPLLCGFPVQKKCDASSSSTTTTTTSQQVPSNHQEEQDSSDVGGNGKRRNHLDGGTIVLISAADAAAVAFIGLIIIYVYWKKKDDSTTCSCTGTTKLGGGGSGGRTNHHHQNTDNNNNNHNDNKSTFLICCTNDPSPTPPYSDGSSTNNVTTTTTPNGGELVALDKSFSFELDELLRASAYVLGKSGLGIVYKVVLGNGVPVAVRRLGEGGADQQRYKEFVSEVNAIAKVKHPNVVTLGAYYWAPDEKLLISDFVSNGNLANALKGGNLSWSTRLRIAKGASKGLAYIHECSPRKYVHADIKPTNILLDNNHNPYISDFGLNRLITITGTDPSSSSSGGLMGGAIPHMIKSSSTPDTSQPYKAPEARLPITTTRPTQKWDVYSFGVILLEMLTGKSDGVCSSSGELQDLVKWVRKGFEEEIALSEIVDPGLLNQVKVKKDVMAVFHIALASTQGDPEIRPRMKNVADNLDKIA